MSQNWMIDVLRDVRGFAVKKSMMGLAEHLDDAIVIASAELRQHAEDVQTMKINERHTPRSDYREAIDG